MGAEAVHGRRGGEFHAHAFAQAVVRLFLADGRDHDAGIRAHERRDQEVILPVIPEHDSEDGTLERDLLDDSLDAPVVHQSVGF